MLCYLCVFFNALPPLEISLVKVEFSPVTEKNVMYLFCLRSADCLPLFTKFPFIHKIANESSRKLQIKKKDIKYTINTSITHFHNTL